MGVELGHRTCCAQKKWWSVRAQVSSFKFQVSSFKLEIPEFWGSRKVVVRERNYGLRFKSDLARAFGPAVDHS